MEQASVFLRKTQRGLFFSLLFFLFCVGAAAADPGFLFLEPGPEMRRAGGGDTDGGGHGTGAGMEKKKSETADKERKAHSSAASGEKDKKKEKRAPMSHPAHYTLRLGGPPLLETDAREGLLQTRAAILRPDGSVEDLTPVQEGPQAIRIRDAALLQGTYAIRAQLDILEEETLFRLFTQARMRTTGEEVPAPPEDPEAMRAAHRPWFSIEDLTPDPGKNYAKILRKHSGDTLALKIRLGEDLLADLPVTLTTSEGWRQTLRTDAKGEVAFTLIKEKFHDKDVQKTASTCFVTAEIRRALPPEAGTAASPPSVREEVLRTSLAFLVYPTPLDWENKAAGFYTLILAALTIALGTAIRRRRKKGAWL